MNKYIKNRSYRNKPVYLSTKDKAAYIISYILILLFSLIVFILYMSTKTVVASWNEDIIAIADNVGSWWIAPLCFGMLGHMCYIDINYRWKDVPFFNRKKRTSPPIAEKAQVRKKRQAKKIRGIIIHILLFVLCVIISLPGLFSRAAMDRNGNLKIYNSFNQETYEYIADDIEYLFITATNYRYETDFQLTLRYSDSSEYVFLTTGFNIVNDYYYESLEGMLRIKKLVPKEKIVIKGTEHLDAVIDLYDFDNDEIDLFYELFTI